MELIVDAPELELQEGQVVILHDARGTRIVARSGSVWVTEEGDRQDHIMGPGDARTVARGGRTVVQALAPSRIGLREAA
jgi:hypothetical protein